MSSSLGAMASLPGKLRLLLVSSKNQLPDPLKDEVKLLIQDLEETRTFLVDLSRAESPMVKLWRNEVREMSYDMEDYIDKMMHPGSNQFEAEEFRILVDLARDACKSYCRYHLGHLRPSNPSFMAGGRGHSRVQTLNREATDIVGMDDAKHKLISWLRDNAEQRLKVVPILGPAGVGKTTLAQEVYREIGGEFECRAFVRASRMTDTRRLLWNILSQIQHHQRPSYDYTVQKLIDSLSEHLQHKRYFIVIDGLWETSSWDTVSSAFPGGAYCSKVLITTDIEEVALKFSDDQPNSIFLIEPLSRDYSADLLNNRVSGFKPELCEQIKGNLEDIVRTCCGLPLAIISIANILECQLWCQVKECISSRLRNNLTPEGILREIVGLNYDCLSCDLKICLLYLGVYPEGYTFLKADLLKQWIAEGFISAVQENANEVAESYFDELVCRGLIQPNHINFSDSIVSYTVHSTMFEVIQYKSMEENFATVIDYSSTIPELSAKVHRLSLRYSNAKYATKPEGITLAPVRSLIFYGFVDCLPSVTEFEVLRVLNLEFWGGQEELDLSGISQLFQLRYMRIAADITVKLPAEMKGLQYLETLEIYGSVTSVPSDIVHLPSLLHLCLLGEIKLSDGISHMRSLRTLHSFDLSSNSEDNVWRLGEMTNLHDLHLTCSKSMSDPLEKKLIALACSIGKLGKLKSFILAPDISCSCCNIYSDYSSSMSCPPVFLQRLELLRPICIFSRLPRWFEQLRNLCVLKIVVRELTRDDVDTIAGLQELTILSLFVRQPSAEKIAFNRAAFPVLKYFKYRCGILRLAFHAETMPSLRTLKLEFNGFSGYLRNNMVSGIENLLNLQEVAGRIGVIPSEVESDRWGAESAFRDAISKHPKPLSVNVQRFEWADQEISQISMQPAALDELPSMLTRDHVKTSEEELLPREALSMAIQQHLNAGGSMSRHIEEIESEDDGLDDEVDDDAEHGHAHEAEDAVPAEPTVKNVVAPPVLPKDTERELSKKKLKKNELAELGLGTSSNSNQDETNDELPSMLTRDHVKTSEEELLHCEALSMGIQQHLDAGGSMSRHIEQQIVLGVRMTNDKSRDMAIKVVAGVAGVTSVTHRGVTHRGEARDLLVVTGNGVDVIRLVNKLRKKEICAEIISVKAPGVVRSVDVVKTQVQQPLKSYYCDPSLSSPAARSVDVVHESENVCSVM